MTDIRTSGFGSSAANNFIINIVDNVTSTTLNKNYPIGNYSISSLSLDTSIDVYAYNSGGTLVGSSTALTFTATGEFNKLVIIGGNAGDVISFSYSQSGFVSTVLNDQTTAPATILSISKTFVDTPNDTISITGANFASNVAVFFKGTDGVERAADSVTRNSTSSLTVTTPDTFPSQHSPYSVIVENPGVARPLISNKHISSNSIYVNEILGWSRPSDWLAITAPEANEQKFVGLLAVHNDDSNYVALLAQGNYTVDWGDGSPLENYTTNTKASHKYTYSSISASTLTSRGYKQVIVTVTPQAGQNLTSINLQQTFTRTNLTTSGQIPWLDIAIAGPNLTSIVLTGSTSPTFRMGWLERVRIISSALTSYANLFAWCMVLKHVEFTTSSTISNTSGMFYGCKAIETIPLFNTSSVTTMSNMFEGCYLLKTIPLLNMQSVTIAQEMFALCSNLNNLPNITTSSLTNAYQMFSGCSSLESVPLFNTSSVTTMGYMFDGCKSLKNVPLFNTTLVTSMTRMFTNCSSLESVPLFNTQSVTTMSGMFQGCNSLKTVPLFNTQSVTSMSDMFFSCHSLKSVPLFSTQSVTDMSDMFNSCYSLESVPLFNTQSVTTMSGMFQDCVSLESVPLFNTQSVTSMTVMFYNCASIKEIPNFNLSSLAAGGVTSMITNTISLQSFTLLQAKSNLTSFPNSYNSDNFSVNSTVSNVMSNSTPRALKTLNVNCTGITAALPYSYLTGASSSGNYFTNLSSVILTGLKYAFNINGARLDGPALNALYTSLGTAAGAQTITVTNNHGTVDDDPSIATAKGWTVTGS